MYVVRCEASTRRIGQRGQSSNEGEDDPGREGAEEVAALQPQ